MTEAEILKILQEKQPWRSEAHNLFLIEQLNGKVPFCAECGDWHSPGELHSTFDGCYSD